MLKGSLTELLFEFNKAPVQLPATYSHPSTSCESRLERNFCNSMTYGSVSQKKKRSKLNQFNDSLIMGEHKKYQAVTPVAPHRNFTIKKIGEIKNKMAVNIQKLAEKELKQQEYMNMNKIKRTYLHEQFGRKEDMQRLLMTSKYPCWEEETYPFRSNRHFHDYGEGKEKQENNMLKQENYENQFKETVETCKAESPLKSATNQKIIKLNNLLKNLQIKAGQSAIPTTSPSPRKRATRHWQEQKKYQQKVEEEKREILELKKQLHKEYAKPFSPPEGITAFAYVIYETAAAKRRRMKKKNQEGQSAMKRMLLHSHKVVAQNNSRSVVEMASLTKIMTCILTIELSQQYEVHLGQEEVIIGAFEQNIGGTSANIKKGQIYSVKQLLYGLMLPSGNDASLAIAVWAGKLLLNAKFKKSVSQGQPPLQSPSNQHYSKLSCYDRFIQEMNVKAAELSMEKTKYGNSHGLANPDNHSCAYDIAILCEYAMNNDVFRDIVSCRCYEGKIKVEANQKDRETVEQKNAFIHKSNGEKKNKESEMEREEMKDMQEMGGDMMEEEEEGRDGRQRQVMGTKSIRWQNTHLLLQNKPQLYSGIKTGITSNAGPCLASSLELNHKRYIVIVLNCKTLSFRFKDTQNLRRWLFNKLELKPG